uniref:Ovule protein n=1 Tax=Globodera rostochiensis TaxID=31243 RepID=A0A914GUH5_GLORO
MFTPPTFIHPLNKPSPSPLHLSPHGVWSRHPFRPRWEYTIINHSLPTAINDHHNTPTSELSLFELNEGEKSK